jgi:hypothetical protein
MLMHNFFLSLSKWISARPQIEFSNYVNNLQFSVDNEIEKINVS